MKGSGTEGHAVEDAAAQGDFVGILQVVANGDAAGDGGHFYSERLKLLVEIEIGGVALHGGGEGEDDFFHWGRIALLYPQKQRVDVKVADAYAVDGGDDPA